MRVYTWNEHSILNQLYSTAETNSVESQLYPNLKKEKKSNLEIVSNAMWVGFVHITWQGPPISGLKQKSDPTLKDWWLNMPLTAVS